MPERNQLSSTAQFPVLIGDEFGIFCHEDLARVTQIELLGEIAGVIDLEGREFLDLFMSFGAGLLGHGHPRIKEAVQKALDLGFPAAYENVYQGQLAAKIVTAVPCAEMVRFTLSGTETTWYAVRIARQYTGRPRILKFEGHFHGFNDYLAYNCWPAPQEAWPALTAAVKGIPEAYQKDTLVLPFNDFERLEETLARHGHEIAAVILEPLPANCGLLVQRKDFLDHIRKITLDTDACSSLMK